MGEVINLESHLVTVGEDYRVSQEAVLKGAAQQSFERMAVVGITEDGEVYVAGTANAGETMILLEMAKQNVVFGRDFTGD